MSASRRVPDLLVEKLALGELSHDDAMVVRSRLAQAGELDRLSVIASDPGVIGPVPEVVTERVARDKARANSQRKVRARSWSLLVTAASFAVMALVVALPSEETTRTKGGGAALVIYRDNDTRGPEVLADGAIAHRGDVLQLAFRPGDLQRAALYSIDGRGLITEHLAPRAVSGRAEVRLDNGYELDDAPRFERFVLLLGDDLDVQVIRLALANLAAADDPATAPLSIPGARVVSRLLLKDAPR